MREVLQTLQKNLVLLQRANRIEKLSKGYSSDEKYVVYFDDRKYLLRIGDMKGYEKKKTEFQILKKMQYYNVQCPQPIDIGALDELNASYSIYSYIDGVDVKETLQNLTEKEQYKIGIEAGIQLSRMHLLEASSSLKPWYERAMKKHYRYLEAYKSCGIKIKNDDKIINFIEENKHFLKERPNQFQHDDFHLENIIVNNRKYAGVIDFDNFDWGDPLHDFVKVGLLQRESSVPFAIGQIKGYFNDDILEDFWMLYSIYAAMVVFSSVIWSLRFAPGELDEMIERLHNMLEDHKDFEILKPVWYEPHALFC
ncbi:aminoglycoside phosphotransferase family protein [Viridibacillus sp. YIM B01967]|uniref:Aminoglycoside phosphotransferase family protein n=1 Tax=Viridibacillus soli TaxID=2798301 RepID=A0ABS1H380_9BACL|nr:aminoglycoside phosphotransferase family protein [Viridibacillus soli]MBK3493864.1 aminoglycoside phosphotransferase family protein [Viridibacillus soli]